MELKIILLRSILPILSIIAVIAKLILLSKKSKSHSKIATKSGFELDIKIKFNKK